MCMHVGIKTKFIGNTGWYKSTIIQSDDGKSDDRKYCLKEKLGCELLSQYSSNLRSHLQKTFHGDLGPVA